MSAPEAGSFRDARGVDHVVMPVASLDWAREWFERLGFTVAPDATHPFGTENACVFLADGTYIEPLGVAQRETCEAEAKAGVVFVARDQAFRFRRGTPGFSAVAFKSSDAAADFAEFQAAGIGTGELFSFARPFQKADGQTAELSFRLAFAADLRAPDCFFFACEPTHRHGPDRTALTAHANGATGIRRLVFSEPNPSDFQYLLQDLLRRREVVSGSFGLSIESANTAIDVLTPQGLKALYGMDASQCRGLLLAGIVLAVEDLSAVRSRLAKAGFPSQEHSDRVVVPLDPRSNCFIAFERNIIHDHTQ